MLTVDNSLRVQYFLQLKVLRDGETLPSADMTLTRVSFSPLFTMKICSKSLLMLLKLTCISLLAVLDAQKLEVDLEVTGYVGHDVTLLCRFISGPRGSNITQIQWDIKQPQKNKTTIIVKSFTFGLNVPDTFLKDRLKIDKQSLMIKAVEMTDAGLYTCSITTFPSGSFEGTTNLVVQEQRPISRLSSGVVSAVVVAVLLLFVIIAAIIYLIFIRRPNSSFQHRVDVDTSGPVMDVGRPSVIVKEDVVYADVKRKSSRNASPASNEKHRAHADDVTYSEVVVLRRHPEWVE